MNNILGMIVCIFAMLIIVLTSINNDKNMTDKQKIEKKLEQVNKELDLCRTSSFVDGWQTQKHAKKSRKWDVLAQEKMELIKKLESYE